VVSGRSGLAGGYLRLWAGRRREAAAGSAALARAGRTQLVGVGGATYASKQKQRPEPVPYHESEGHVGSGDAHRSFDGSGTWLQAPQPLLQERKWHGPDFCLPRDGAASSRGKGTGSPIAHLLRTTTTKVAFNGAPVLAILWKG